MGKNKAPTQVARCEKEGKLRGKMGLSSTGHEPRQQDAFKMFRQLLRLLATKWENDIGIDGG